MTETEQIAKALRMLETAESSLKAAREILGGKDLGHLRSHTPVTGEGSRAYELGETQIIEGTFDGQNMIGPNEKIYPVAANYSSKSKLVEGDRLKLTIMPNGSFLYKQIAPADRSTLKGRLINEDGHYQVLAEGNKYRVLLASVTYYKGTVGDEVTLVVPTKGDSQWAAIEAIIPQVQTGNYNEEDSF